MPEPEFLWVDIDQIRPNPWNPNQMSDDMLDKEIESIHRFGFVDPITCREADSLFEIIDGEHRWRVAQDHSDACRKVKGKYVEHIGLRQLPVTDLGELSDHIAKQLTVVLNETRGEAQPKKLGLVLVELLAAEPLPQLLELLPFTKDQFEELAELPKVDWDNPTPKVASGKSEDRWVERVYRLPVAAAEALDQAIREAKEGGSQSDWQAIQRIAEEFVA